MPAIVSLELSLTIAEAISFADVVEAGTADYRPTDRHVLNMIAKAVRVSASAGQDPVLVNLDMSLREVELVVDAIEQGVETVSPSYADQFEEIALGLRQYLPQEKLAA